MFIKLTAAVDIYIVYRFSNATKQTINDFFKVPYLEVIY